MKKLLILLLLMAGTAQAQTFGDSTGTYSDIDATGRLHSVLATMPEAGTLTHIKVFVNNTGHYNDYYFNFFIMTSDTVLVDTTETYHYTSTMTSGWVTLPVVAGASLTARNYYIGFKHVAGASGGPDDSLHVMRGSNAGSALARRDYVAYPALGQKNGSAWTPVPDYRYQILAVYTTGGTCTTPTNTLTDVPDSSVAGRFAVHSSYGTSTLDSIQYRYDSDSTISGSTRIGAYPDSGTTHTIISNGHANNDWFRVWSIAFSTNGTTCADTDFVDCKTLWVSPDKHIGIGRD
jgi:hypothetical protein